MAMLENRRKKNLTALFLVAPFVVAFSLFFFWPTIQMVRMSFTNAPLIGEGEWVGFDNYVRLWSDRLFRTSIWNNAYFILLTVIPTTVIALCVALAINRLKGWKQAFIMVLFFLPYILPVSVVTQVWAWMLDQQYGVLQPVIELIAGKRVAVFKDPVWVMPMIALVTVWWTNGFNVLLFIAGLRNISAELYEAAALDGATRGQQFWRVTWPLLWPVTALILTLQLILQLKIFDQIYLLSGGGPFNTSYVLLMQVYREAFQLNHGGYSSAVATVLFLIIAIISILQFQILRIGRAR